MTDAARFSVFLFFPDGTNECVAERVDAETAVLKAKDYSERPAADLGVVARIIIADAEDFTAFEWRFGKGIVFPTREQCEEAK